MELLQEIVSGILNISVVIVIFLVAGYFGFLLAEKLTKKTWCDKHKKAYTEHGFNGDMDCPDCRLEMMRDYRNNK